MAGEWRDFPFPEVIDFQEGPGILAKDFCEVGVPLVRLAGLDRGVSVLNGCDYLDPKTVGKRWAHFALKEGDILLSSSASLGRIAVVGNEAVGAIPYTGIIRMRPKDDRLVAPFIRYLLEGPYFQRQAEMVGVGSVIRHFGPMHLREMSVSLPPSEEQKRIVDILGTLDDKIELNRRMNETLEAMARALFKSWFVDFDPVRAKLEGREAFYAPELWSLFPDALDADDKPSGWPLGTLIDLCELKRGYDLPTAQRLPGPYPIVSSSGISGSHSVPMAQGPGVVTGRYGTIGEVYFVSEPYWPLNTALYVRDFKGNSPRFVYYELLHVEFQKYSDKAAVPGINRNHLHQAPVVLPSRAVQQAFETLLAPVWQRQESNMEEIASLTALRDTLLPKLISGELRVKAAEKIVESVA